MLVMVGLVVGTTLILSAVVFPLQEAAIRDRAFDVCEVSALSISSSAGEALLTDQVLLLEDILRNIQASRVEGLREISVIFRDSYFVHTQAERRGTEVESDILSRVRSLSGAAVTRQEIVVRLAGENRDAYEFLTPIRFQDRVIGTTRIVYDAEAIRSPIRRARVLAAVIAAITLAISFAATFFVSGTVARPILQVAEAARRVGEGDLDVRLNIRSLDELGTLATRFNHMVDEMKEKLHMTRFVSGSTVQMIRNQRDGEMKLGGSRQESAFFFSDVRGFTAWTEKTSPEKVVEILNLYLDLQAQIIHRHGGDIDKFVGDEIMAVFNGPDREDNCLSAAVEVIEHIKKLNETRSEHGLTVLNVGIGCHSGEVVVGNMGSKDRMDFTAIGDVVNLSARLCSSAEALKIVTTKEMLSKTRLRFQVRDMEPIKVKGKEQAIEIAGVLRLMKESAPRRPGNHDRLAEASLAGVGGSSAGSMDR